MTEELKQVTQANHRLSLEIRQIKLEKQHLQRSNQYYVAQVSQMEVKISELNAHVQSQERAIQELQSQLAEVQANAQDEQADASRDDLALLKEENEYLKSLLEDQGSLSELKIQLEHALSMKDTFEEKYRKAKTELLRQENAQTSDNVTTRLEELAAENTALKEHYLPKMQAELDQYAQDKYDLETQLIFLTDQLRAQQQTADAPKPELSKPESFRSELSKPDLYKPDLSKPDMSKTDLSKTESFKSESLKPEPSKAGAIYKSLTERMRPAPKLAESNSMSQLHRKIGAAKVVDYVPSFQRTMKPGQKKLPEVMLNLDDSDSDS